MYFMLIVIEKIPKFKESSGLDFNGNSLKAPPQYFYDSLQILRVKRENRTLILGLEDRNIAFMLS